jgi:hypothetical protein
MRSRFFSGGPTSIYRILTDIDAGISDANARFAAGSACLGAKAVAYTLTPFGQSIPFFAQCHMSMGAGGFFQMGQKNGATFLYSEAGAGSVAVQMTPVAGGDAGPGGYAVHAWIGIDDGRVTGGSYGVIELLADTAAGTIELAVAGRGFGYCGAHLRSDGTNVYEIGSIDMVSCAEPATLCASAADVTQPGTCDAALETFALAPLGRMASAGATGTLGASGYPGEPSNVVNLDGTASDSVSFGPRSPTAGTLSLTP